MRRSSQGMMSLSYDAGSGRGLLARYAKAKPRPSKWDDAQRWLSSRTPDDDRRRSSCADDRMLLPSASQKGRHSWGAADGDATVGVGLGARDDGEAETETKRVDSVLAYGQQRCLSLRDVGTEMTPGGSKEPSRANTPRATALAAAPPTAAASHAIHALRHRPGSTEGGSPGHIAADRCAASEGTDTEVRKEACAVPMAVSPGTAWDAAERAKHMARYRREEMKIQAWENRRRQKAELQMKMTEAKAERMKLRAQEKTASKLASAQAVTRDKRARAEAKLNQRTARVEGKADLLRRGGHLPSSSVFSLKLPLLCS
ncbi:remorin-like [Phragmites australis]|uniref:remorin-like n=1 Tax=Phragmites australis TaxID=29695 RepID=UPI002D778794|nr:remorin-like [Phragmites australis]